MNQYSWMLSIRELALIHHRRCNPTSLDLSQRPGSLVRGPQFTIVISVLRSPCEALVGGMYQPRTLVEPLSSP